MDVKCGIYVVYRRETVIADQAIGLQGNRGIPGAYKLRADPYQVCATLLEAEQRRTDNYPVS